MELGKLTITHQLTKISGWLSVITGLIILFLLNMALLTSFSIDIMNDFTILNTICIFSAVVALFNKQHRSLGIWGLSIAIFSIIIIFCSFFLGWLVVPFP